jgi:hypothetical protein
VKYWTAPLLSVFLFILITYLIFNSSTPQGIWTTLNASHGTLILNIFSKGTDYALLAAAKLMWDRIAWGPLLVGAGTAAAAGGERLLTFWVLTGGVAAWWKILCFGGSKTAEAEMGMQEQSADGEERPPPLLPSSPPVGRAGHFVGHPRIWAVARFVDFSHPAGYMSPGWSTNPFPNPRLVAAVLLQFPGIILMGKFTSTSISTCTSTRVQCTQLKNLSN